MAEGLEIKLGREVGTIDWSTKDAVGNDTVTVSCTNGEVYSAGSVIFSASMGVLKAATAEKEGGGGMFSPALPDEKLRAIHEVMNIGPVGKLYAEWEGGVPDVISRGGFLWKGQRHPAEGGWWRGMRDIGMVHDDEGNVVGTMTWMTGDACLQMERDSEEDVRVALGKALQGACYRPLRSAVPVYMLDLT
jgi:hypothetical protein